MPASLLYVEGRKFWSVTVANGWWWIRWNPYRPKLRRLDPPEPYEVELKRERERQAISEALSATPTLIKRNNYLAEKRRRSLIRKPTQPKGPKARNAPAT
jgi:hypothetical protein